MSHPLRVALVVVVSIVSGLTLALAVSAVEIATGFPLFGFSLLFVVPVGAVGCGFVAAVGFFSSSRLLHVRPTGGLLLVPLVTALVSFVASHWFTFSRYEFAVGRTYADVMTFADYLRAVTTESGLSLGESASIDRLGSFGYLVAGLEIVGSGAGGWLALAVLRAQPWCEASGRFMWSVDHRKQLFETQTQFHQALAQVHQLVDEGEPAAAVLVLSDRWTRIKDSRHGRFALTVDHYECPSCRRSEVVITTEERDKRGWQQTSCSTLDPRPADDLALVASSA